MEKQLRVCAILLFLSSGGFGRNLMLPSSAAGLVPVTRAKLCITEGAIEEGSEKRLVVTVPKMRAFVAAAAAHTVEARFTYLGPADREARLGSGELRRQFGLKLRAQNGCNVVYAMWRIEPESKIVVSVKSNPGMRTSAECRNRGYHNIKPRRSLPVPRLHLGDSHRLRAEMNGSEMRVLVDGSLAWEGDVGPEGLSFDGPVGLRTDNGRFEFELFAGQLPRGAEIEAPPCHEDSDERE